MALTVETNSYITVDEADTYLVDHIYYESRWSGLSSGQKETYLIQACRDLEQLNFIGKKYDSGQELEFPRRIIENDSDFDDITPDGIKRGQAEQAFWLVSNYARREERLAMDSLNITDFGISEIKEERQKIGYGISREAMKWLTYYIKGNNTKTFYRT